MRTETINVYQFDELSDDAKARARDWFRADGNAWAWVDEWWNSAQAFSAIAPIEIQQADYDRGHVDIVWTDDDAVKSLHGVRAWKWLLNNGWFDFARKNKDGDCTMTGFCGDCAFGDAILAYLDKPAFVPELKQVFYKAAQTWISDAQSDMYASDDDENVDETIRCNEYEFNEDGSFYS